jgi:hypothetical protein
VNIFLVLCRGPLALIPVNGKKNRGQNSDRKMSESCLLVDHTGHSASGLRGSAVYLQFLLFLNMTPQKTQKKDVLFMGFPGTFARLKSRLS